MSKGHGGDGGGGDEGVAACRRGAAVSKGRRGDIGQIAAVRGAVGCAAVNRGRRTRSVVPPAQALGARSVVPPGQVLGASSCRVLGASSCRVLVARLVVPPGQALVARSVAPPGRVLMVRPVAPSCQAPVASPVTSQRQALRVNVIWPVSSSFRRASAAWSDPVRS